MEKFIPEEFKIETRHCSVSLHWNATALLLETIEVPSLPSLSFSSFPAMFQHRLPLATRPFKNHYQLPLQ
jgi:hypothetical protein